MQKMNRLHNDREIINEERNGTKLRELIVSCGSKKRFGGYSKN